MRIWFNSRLINAITNDYLLKCLHYLWAKNRSVSCGRSLPIKLTKAKTEKEFWTTEKIERIKDKIKKNDREFVINTHTVSLLASASQPANETLCALPFISSKCTVKGEEHAFLMIYTHTHNRNAYHHNFFELLYVHIPFALLLWLFAAVAVAWLFLYNKFNAGVHYHFAFSQQQKAYHICFFSCVVVDIFQCLCVWAPVLLVSFCCNSFFLLHLYKYAHVIWACDMFGTMQSDIMSCLMFAMHIVQFMLFLELRVEKKIFCASVNCITLQEERRNSSSYHINGI